MTSAESTASNASPHTLVLLRHAKAETWSAEGGDRARHLSARGRRDAAAAGRWLAVQALRPDIVLCSPSARTLDTWAAVAAELGAAAPMTADDRIYDADVDDLLEVIHEVDAGAVVVLVIGHAPGIPELASMLDGSQNAALDERFPTSTIAALEVPTDWADVDEGCAELMAFVTPRG